MATPAAVLSTLIKVQGMQPALTQLQRYDAAGRKASLGADKAAASSTNLGRSARGASPHIGGMVKAALGAVGAFAAFSAAKSAVTDVLSLSGSVAKLTAITGMDAKQASIWIETMKVRGVETKAVSMGFITLARNMRAATNGSGKAADAFKEIGISQDVIKKGDMNDILLRSADAFAKMRNPAERAALAQQLFGRQAQALIPFLSQGRAGVEGALAAAERYGAFLPKNVDTLNKAREAQRGMNLAMDGVKITFATAVMPALVTGAQAVMNFVAQMRSGEGAGGAFAKIISTAFTFIKGVVQAVIPVVREFINQIINSYGTGGTFRDIFVTAFNVVRTAVQILETVFTAAFPVIKDIVLGTFNTVKWIVENILVPAFRFAKWATENILIPAFNIAKAAVAVFMAVFKLEFDLIKGIVTSAFNVVKAVWDAVLHPVFNAIVAVLSVTVIPAVKLLGSIFGSVFSGIKNVFVGALDAILGGFSSLLRVIADVAGVKLPFIGRVFGNTGRDIDNVADSVDQFRNQLRNIPSQKKVDVSLNWSVTGAGFSAGKSPFTGGPVGSPDVDTMFEQIIDKLSSNLGKTLIAGESPFGGLGNVAGIANRMGLVLTSGYRPGDPGWHGQNRARDFAGGTIPMLNFARFMAASYGRRLLELIHTPLGFGIKNGSVVPLSFWGAATNAAHYNHVHVAMEKGGHIKKSGWAVVGERGPELAHLPTGTDVYSNRDSRSMSPGGPMVNIEHLEVHDSFDERMLAHRLAFLLEM